MNEEIPTEDVIAEPQTAIAKARARPKGSFAGDVLKLVSGTTFAQALGVLLSPLLTRLYSPESFGVLALFTSITGIISVVACLRYELAIMLPERDEEAANLLAVSLLSVVAIAALSLLIVSLGRPLLLGLLRAPALGPYLWLVPLMVFFAGAFGALNYWNSRTKHFGRLSVVRVLSAFSTYTVNLGVGYAGHATGGTLIGAAVLGSALSALELGRRIWRDDKGLFRANIRLPFMRQGMVRYQKFPLIDTWSALLNTVSWQLPPLMLSYFFSATVVGHYALGLRVLQLPMSLIGGAIAQVFFQRAAEAKLQGALDRVARSTFQRLASFGLFPILILSVIGREAFTVVFGYTWGQAGVYAQILSLWIFFWFVSSPITTIVSVLEKQRFGLFWNVTLLATRLASLLLGGILGSPQIALGLFSATGAIVYGYVVFKLLAFAGVSWSEMVSPLGRVLLRFLPAGLLLMFLKVYRSPNWIMVVVGALAIAVYYGFEASRDRRLQWLVSRVIAHRKT